MLKEIFHESFENFETKRICVEKHASVTGWQKLLLLIQIIMLPTFGGLCNRYFWDIRLKMLRLLNFKMVFQLALRKFFKSELFLCLLKVDHVIKLRKEPTGAKSFKNNPTLIKRERNLMRVWWAPSRIFWKLFICPCNKSWWDYHLKWSVSTSA